MEHQHGCGALCPFVSNSSQTHHGPEEFANKFANLFGHHERKVEPQTTKKKLQLILKQVKYKYTKLKIYQWFIRIYLYLLFYLINS